jgi:hypothetical protein
MLPPDVHAVLDRGQRRMLERGLDEDGELRCMNGHTWRPAA